MAQTKQAPTPEANTPVQADATVAEPTTAKKAVPSQVKKARTVRAMIRTQEKVDSTPRKPKHIYTHEYKVTVEKEVGNTLSELSEASGFSVRQLTRIALSHLIKIYAPHYGLENWAAPEVRLPPPVLSPNQTQTVVQPYTPQPQALPPNQPLPWTPPQPAKSPYSRPDPFGNHIVTPYTMQPDVTPPTPMWQIEDAGAVPSNGMLYGIPYEETKFGG
ncbi:hypothetical protein V757_00355 [Pelistega indica]|uniref:Uncharacterized protein n=1 Tax=Pelistega indica TaxID=1414851 RepID=V8GBG5_9BURK|nr:hypothetical protein [Pelistega indica]ETD73092.1 hypothetical protein V757_00355 [Pelistega indica]